MIIHVDLYKNSIVQFGWNDEMDEKLLELAVNAKYTEKGFSHFLPSRKLLKTYKTGNT
jgi:hypothetical protein